ncbi:MAG: bile acid:sodium symporter [Spirochaetaceae bacterium]|nr:bile acid:sodium symporter [Spirochaetaceae bacterium]
MQILSSIKKNWLIIGIFVAVICGYYFPEFAKIINKDRMFSTFLVIFLFFIQGFILQKEKVFSGIKNLKLHVTMLFFTFIFYPLYFFIFVNILPLTDNEGVIAGLFILACLPTTIASCAVFTSLAGGNTSGVIFNTVISNTAGVFITPLLFSFMVTTAALVLPLSMLSEVLVGLVIRIIIPMALGMILRNFFIEFIDKNRKKFSTASSIAILCILFLAFAESSNYITSDLVATLYPVFIFLAVSYFIISFIIYKTASLLGFPEEDIIASVFTGAQKTLAGAPLITLFFKDSPHMLGIVLIPLLFFHPWQLFSSTFIVKYFLRKKESG